MEDVQADSKSVSDDQETEPASDLSDEETSHLPVRASRASSNTICGNEKELTLGQNPLSDAEIIRKRNRAARSRFARKRRKIATELLRLETWQLEKDQIEKKRIIASLQNKIQSLKFKNHFPPVSQLERKRLLVENKLLKAELKKIKAAVNQFKELIRRNHNDSFKNERLRVLNTATQIPFEQILGLGYVSMYEDSWIPQNFQTNLRNNSNIDESAKIYLRYQYLPHGSCLKEAERVNIRIDCMNFVTGDPSYIAQYLHTHIQTPQDSVESWERFINSNRSTKVKWKSLKSFARSFNEDEEEDYDIRLTTDCDFFQYREEVVIKDSLEESIIYRKDAVFMIALSSIALTSDAFPKRHERLSERLKNAQEPTNVNETFPGYILSVAGFRHDANEDDEDLPVLSDPSRFDQFFGGYIVDASEIQGKTNIRIIVSIELNNKGDALAFQDPLKWPPISKHGDVNQDLVLFYIRTLSKILKQ